MARDFTGSPNDLSASDSASWDQSGAFAAAAWVKRDTNTEGAVVSKWSNTNDRSFILYVDTSGNVNAALLHTNLATSSVAKSGFTQSVWHHVGFELDGIDANGRVRAYLDGVAGTDFNPPNTGMVNSTLSVHIGSSVDDTTDRYWDGPIAEVAAWTTGLSAAEWQAMAKGVTPNRIRPASLLAYVPLWGVGSSEPDLSGNGNHFTINGTLNQRDHAPLGPPFPLVA